MSDPSATTGFAVRLATDDDRDRWDDYVRDRPQADILQAWAWASAGIASGERWLRLLCIDRDDRLHGVSQVHVRPTALGGALLYAPHGPIWDRDAPREEQILGGFLVGLRDVGRRHGGIALKLDPRGHGDGGDAGVSLLAHGLRRARYDLQAPTTRVVDLLDGGEQLMATWVPDARTRVRRARKEGIVTTVDRSADPATLDAFHGLLSETAQRARFRIRPRSFLGALADALVRSGDWFLALAWYEDRPVAGIVGPRVGDRAYYLYAASTRDPAMEHKRVGYAAMAGLMRAHAEAGTRTLDLWGVREPGDALVDPSWEGFSSFKTRFGGRPLRHAGTFDLVIDPLWYGIRDLRERLLRRRRHRSGPPARGEVR